MDNCLFCTIAADSSKLVWQNDIAAAFADINPKAPVHLLIVPKLHIEKLDSLDDIELGGQLLAAVKEVAVLQGLSEGYKVVINNGRAGGQEIDHLHLHLLGGKSFSE